MKGKTQCMMQLFHFVFQSQPCDLGESAILNAKTSVLALVQLEYQETPADFRFDYAHNRAAGEDAAK
jgi:hypothetical protein